MKYCPLAENELRSPRIQKWLNQKCDSFVQLAALEEASRGIFERPEFTIALTYFFDNLQRDLLRLFFAPPIQLPSQPTLKTAFCRQRQQTMQQLNIIAVSQRHFVLEAVRDLPAVGENELLVQGQGPRRCLAPNCCFAV